MVISADLIQELVKLILEWPWLEDLDLEMGDWWIIVSDVLILLE